VTRFRSLRFRSFTMPLLLAALALRVLIPTDVMTVTDVSRMTASSSMCSGAPGRIEIPEGAPKPHCERCLLTPPFDAPYAMLAPLFRQAVQAPLLREQVSQSPESSLARVQSARAPPRA
jgi:hypothetical protein